MNRSFYEKIDRFLGLRESDGGEVNSIKGESPRMKNLEVAEDYTLRIRKGFECIYETGAEGRAIWSGALKNEERIVWVSGSTVTQENSRGITVIGSLESDSGHVTIFPFGEKLYFLDGRKIKVFDGESFGDVVPYVPTIALSCDYKGAGIPFEDVNLLTGTKKQCFTFDGSHTTFALLESEIDSVDEVKYLGERLIYDENYRVNLKDGRVTVDIEMETTPNSIEITYTKNAPEFPEYINRMKYAIAYGGENDTRVFLWGDPEYPCHLRYSGVFNGESGFEYFPELSFNKIGSGAPITSVVRHYDRMMIFCKGEAYYSYGESKTGADGVDYNVYPVKTLSSQVGCSEYDFSVLIDNAPVTFDNYTLYKWSSSAVRDERNAVDIGTRIKAGLRKMKRGEVVSFDRATTGELYICRGEDIYVYNYKRDVFYYHTGAAPISMTEQDGHLYFIQRDGRVFWENDTGLDDGQPIEFYWESSFGDFCGLATKNVYELDFEVYPSEDIEFLLGWESELSSRDCGLMCGSYGSRSIASPVTLFKRVKAKRVRGFKVNLKNSFGVHEFHLYKIGVRGKLTDSR